MTDLVIVFCDGPHLEVLGCLRITGNLLVFRGRQATQNFWIPRRFK